VSQFTVKIKQHIIRKSRLYEDHQLNAKIRRKGVEHIWGRAIYDYVQVSCSSTQWYLNDKDKKKKKKKEKDRNSL
jgi:hypothetical protein